MVLQTVESAESFHLVQKLKDDATSSYLAHLNSSAPLCHHSAVNHIQDLIYFPLQRIQAYLLNQATGAHSIAPAGVVEPLS